MVLNFCRRYKIIAWMVIFVGTLFWCSISEAAFSQDLNNFLGQYTTSYSAWSGTSWLGKEQVINFNGSYAPIESFTLEFAGQVNFPLYKQANGSVSAGLINSNFDIWDLGHVTPHFNYAIGINIDTESYQIESTGYKAVYRLNGNQFTYTLSMCRASTDTAENWDAGFPSGQVWTGLAFMYYPFSDGRAPFQEGSINITEASLIISKSQPAPVPVPSTIYLLSAGLLGLTGLRGRFKKR
jgi:hypothetical protein